MRLLLISNSTNAGEEYLAYAMPEIGNFLKGVKRVAFIPYAGVRFSYDAYQDKVAKRFAEAGIAVDSIHKVDAPKQLLQDAEAIVIGGGNTWRLLQQMQEKDLLGVIREKVIAGTPYVGWSAGSNVSCPTISTTNDMPAVVPHGFEALHLVDFQINPHYLDANPAGHAGETREERIIEYIELNRDMTVVGLREGTMLRIEGEKTDLIGKKPARIFHYGKETYEIYPGKFELRK